MPKVVPGYKEQAQSRILSVAREVISEKGWFATRMVDIAARVGVSKRTLYIYFKDKEALFKAMYAAGPAEVGNALTQVFEKAQPGDACGMFFDQSMAGPQTGLDFEIIAAASRNPSLLAVQRELMDRKLEVVSQFLGGDDRKKRKAGGFDARQKARVVIALHLGLKAELLMGANKSEIRKAWVEATDRIMGDG
jgi:AcrR family transcriptional regulator